MVAVDRVAGVRRIGVAAGGVLAALWLAQSATVALAGQWTITPRASVAQAITDNAR